MKAKAVKGNWSLRTNKLSFPYVFLVCIFFFLAGFFGFTLFSHSQVFLLSFNRYVVSVFQQFFLWHFFFVFFFLFYFCWKILKWLIDRWEFAGRWRWLEAEAEAAWFDERGGVQFDACWRAWWWFHYFDSFPGVWFCFFKRSFFFFLKGSSSALESLAEMLLWMILAFSWNVFFFLINYLPV